jgi:hypothetical protein
VNWHYFEHYKKIKFKSYLIVQSLSAVYAQTIGFKFLYVTYVSQTCLLLFTIL